MKYVIMAAGEGKRWNNFLGVPKHLIEINGETLLERTTRLLKENGVDDFVITGNDERYSKYGKLVPQTDNECEIDRFEESIVNGSVCYLYGDVYYTDQAIKTIIDTKTNDIEFFGSEFEIFAIKVENLDLFFNHKHKVKELYLEGKINRCIGWEVYRSINNIPFEEHVITEKYVKILDGTDDIDYPTDLEHFLNAIGYKGSKKDFVSVIIPNYNSKQWCEPLLEKLVYQKKKYYPETEIILVDDFSTEDVSWLDKFENDVKIYKNEENKGVSYTRNYGLEKSNGDYIQFVDSDDDITDDFLHIIYTNMRKGYDYCLYRWYVNNQVTQGDMHKDSLLWNWAVWGYTLSRAIIGNIRFDENLKCAEDIDFLRKIIHAHLNRCLVDKPIYIYNTTNGNSISHKWNRGEL